MMMRFEIKNETVQVFNLHPSVLLGLMAVWSVWSEMGFALIRLTSGHETPVRHGMTSLHWPGFAIDIHSKTLGTPDQRKLAADLVNKRLGPDIDFILEGAGTRNEHFHLESQPKRRKADGTVG